MSAPMMGPSWSGNTKYIGPTGPAGSTGATGPQGTAGPSLSNWSPYPATTDVDMSNFNIVNAPGLANSSGTVTIAGSNISNTAVNKINLTADRGVDVLGNAEVNLLAQNGNHGVVSLTANGGYNNGINGEVNITANGSTLGSFAQGGLINITANTPVSSNYTFTSAIKMGASSILSYAGSFSSYLSLAGYNYTWGQVGVNITCTPTPPSIAIPNTAGTVFISGYAGTKISNELYVDAIKNYAGQDLTISSPVFSGSNANISVVSGKALYLTATTGTAGVINMNGNTTNIQGNAGNLNLTGGSSYIIMNALGVRINTRLDMNGNNIGTVGNIYFSLADTIASTSSNFIISTHSNMSANVGGDFTVNANTNLYLNAGAGYGIHLTGASVDVGANLYMNGNSISDIQYLNASSTNMTLYSGSNIILYAVNVNVNANMNMCNNNITNIGTATAQKLIGTYGNTPIASVSALALVNGDPYTVTGRSQIEFQYNGGGYNHYITSRHNASSVNNNSNAIDFWLYSTTGGQTSSPAPNNGNVAAMSVTARGVGIFNTTPTSALDVIGVTSLNGNLLMNSCNIQQVNYISNTTCGFNVNTATGYNVALNAGGAVNIASGSGYNIGLNSPIATGSNNITSTYGNLINFSAISNAAGTGTITGYSIAGGGGTASGFSIISNSPSITIITPSLNIQADTNFSNNTISNVSNFAGTGTISGFSILSNAAGVLVEADASNFVNVAPSGITATGGSNYISVPSSSSFIATGGAITDVGGRRFHTFTSNDTFIVTANPDHIAVEIFAIGGGGGGGSLAGGGGGAGNAVIVSYIPAIGSNSIAIGSGGAGGNYGYGYPSANGNPTTVSGVLTATGGGGGGVYTQNAGQRGGCGGGGSEAGYEAPGGVDYAVVDAGTVIANMATAGGTGATVAPSGGAGGGGASAAGGDTSAFTSLGANGGDGYLYYGTYYGGGGGGQAGDPMYGTPTPGTGGLGGGGAGAVTGNGTFGTANTGGGGGGGPDSGGTGGSGIVIISYPVSSGIALTSPYSIALNGTVNASGTVNAPQVIVSHDLSVAAMSSDLPMGAHNITNCRELTVNNLFNSASVSPITNNGNQLFYFGAFTSFSGTMQFQIGGHTWDGTSIKVGKLPPGVYVFSCICGNALRQLSLTFFVLGSRSSSPYNPFVTYGATAHILASGNDVRADAVNNPVTAGDPMYLTFTNNTSGAGDDFNLFISLVSGQWDGTTSWKYS